MGMEIESRHVFLAQAENREDAVYQVIHFLQTTDLISYSQLNVDETEVMVGDGDSFWETLRQSVEKNRVFSRQILEELQKNGIHEVVDLLTIPLGYPSKLLHVLTHMLDGFFGIDSVFYNLVEDSHWVGDTLEVVIRETPQQFWLVPVETGEVERSVLPSATMVDKN
jgi:hypothetical protein